EFGHAGVGRPPRRRADLAGDHVPVRRHRAATAPVGSERACEPLNRGPPAASLDSGTRLGDPYGFPQTPSLSLDRAFRSIATAVFLVSASLAAAAAAAAQDVNAGKAVYERKCLLCHGEKGDGNGPGAEHLLPKPRDFTRGLFKIRSTANKTPTDQDLFRIVTDGMPGTSMPAWEVLPERGRRNVVAYIKSFSPDTFKEAPKKLELPKEVASSEASIKRGNEMFEAIECHKCHGTEGRADGPSRPELKDEWGHPVAPANLTKRWNFRGGRSRTEIATRIANGVLGTPMPAFLDSVEKPEDIWHLTNYIV